jgi:hypothetical protein
MRGHAMSDSLRQSGMAGRGYAIANLLTGCHEGAMAVATAAADEVGKHPAASEAGRIARLFFAAVRRRSLRFPARCDLDGALAGLHAMQEPARSAHVLRLVGAMDDAEIAGVLGVAPGTLPPEPDNWAALRGHAGALRPPKSALGTLEALEESLREEAAEGRSCVRNPATIAVALGFLLLVGMLVWQMTGQAGVFPEEALKIASVGRRADFDQFAPVEVKASRVGDWFVMQGFDGFAVPVEFGDYDAVGVRTFKVDGNTVAQVAAIDGERRVFFLSFEAVPFRIPAGGGWRVATSGRHVVAMRRDGEMCFLVSFEGTPGEMHEALGGGGPEA